VNADSLGPEVVHLLARVRHCSAVVAERARIVADLMEAEVDERAIACAVGWLVESSADLDEWSRELDEAIRVRTGPVDITPHFLDATPAPAPERTHRPMADFEGMTVRSLDEELDRAQFWIAGGGW